MTNNFVVLEGLKHGNQFFTTYDGGDPTKLSNGNVAYKILGYAETSEGAQTILHKIKPMDQRLKEYLGATMTDMILRYEKCSTIKG